MIRPYLPTDLEAVLDTWYQSTTLAHPFMTEAFKAKERKNIEDIYIKNTITNLDISVPNAAPTNPKRGKIQKP